MYRTSEYTSTHANWPTENLMDADGNEFRYDRSIGGRTLTREVLLVSFLIQLDRRAYSPSAAAQESETENNRSRQKGSILLLGAPSRSTKESDRRGQWFRTISKITDVRQTEQKQFELTRTPSLKIKRFGCLYENDKNERWVDMRNKKNYRKKEFGLGINGMPSGSDWFMHVHRVRAILNAIFRYKKVIGANVRRAKVKQ